MTDDLEGQQPHEEDEQEPEQAPDVKTDEPEE